MFLRLLLRDQSFGAPFTSTVFPSSPRLFRSFHIISTPSKSITMKSMILASLVASAAAFAPAPEGRMSTAVNADLSKELGAMAPVSSTLPHHTHLSLLAEQCISLSVAGWIPPHCRPGTQFESFLTVTFFRLRNLFRVFFFQHSSDSMIPSDSAPMARRKSSTFSENTSSPTDEFPCSPSSDT